MNAGKSIRVVALAVALFAAFFNIIPYVAQLMILLGLAIGLIGLPEERRILFMVMAVTLNFVANALNPLPLAGPYLTDILGNLSTILNAGAVAVIGTIIYEWLTE